MHIIMYSPKCMRMEKSAADPSGWALHICSCPRRHMNPMNAANSLAMTAGTTAQETVEMADATVAAARLTVPAKNAHRPACCALVVVGFRGK